MHTNCVRGFSLSALPFVNRLSYSHSKTINIQIIATFNAEENFSFFIFFGFSVSKEAVYFGAGFICRMQSIRTQHVS